MIYIIGDIHGELTKLKKLIHNIKVIDFNAEFVFIGDYLDKGENVLGTLDFLSDLSKTTSCSFLLGNHEYLWLRLPKEGEKIEKYLLEYGGRMTLKSLGVSNIYSAHNLLVEKYSHFFSRLVTHYFYGQYLIVHSGILPSDYDKDINKIDIKNLLFNRYEFIKQKKYYLDKYRIIFGHTGFLSPYIDKYKIGIDTAACFLKEQPLTAFCVNEEFFIDSHNNFLYLEKADLNSVPIIPKNKPFREI